MKRLICILLLLCLLSACGQAEEISELQRRAQADLTEVLGFTEEEAARFVFETQADGSVRYWDPAQPDLVYTEYYSDDAWHAVLATTPYDTQFSARAPENTVAEILRAARREGWFLRWDESARKALLDACGGVVWAPTELCFAQTAGQALQALFVGFYGPEMGWTKGVTARRDAAMAEYGLVPEELPFRVPGIRRTENTEPIGAVRTITLFDGEIPEELTGVLADPHLAGWTLETGALLTRDWGSMHVPTGGGLAILERDGTRQLIQLGLLDGRWVAFPLGADALYQGVPCRVTYDGLHRYFAIQYQLSDTRTAVFYVSPSLNRGSGMDRRRFLLHAHLEMGKRERRNDLGPAGAPLSGAVSHYGFPHHSRGCRPRAARPARRIHPGQQRQPAPAHQQPFHQAGGTVQRDDGAGAGYPARRPLALDSYPGGPV